MVQGLQAQGFASGYVSLVACVACCTGRIDIRVSLAYLLDFVPTHPYMTHSAIMIHFPFSEQGIVSLVSIYTTGLEYSTGGIYDMGITVLGDESVH